FSHSLVIRYRSLLDENRSMSAMPRERRLAVKASPVAMGHFLPRLKKGCDEHEVHPVSGSIAERRRDRGHLDPDGYLPGDASGTTQFTPCAGKRSLGCQIVTARLARHMARSRSSLARCSPARVGGPNETNHATPSFANTKSVPEFSSIAPP